MATGSANTTGWSAESQALLEAGYLRFKDGSLIRWAPNQEPDPLLVQMNKMKISEQKPYVPLTFDEEVAFLIKEYEALHPIKIDPKKSKK